MPHTDPQPAPPTGHVVVVGGGVAGLVAAYELETAGAAVTLLEAGEQVGGKLRRAEVAGHLVDVGAEAMLAVRPEAVDLVARLGAGADLVAPATTAAQVWSRGALHPLPRATLMGIPSAPESARGILSDAEVERARHEQPWPTGALTDDVAVGDYVAARLGDAVVDRLVEPLLGGVYAGHARRLSLRATMPGVWQAATADRSLLEAAAPRAAGETAAARRPPFAGIVGGVGRIPELLRDALRATVVRTGTIARELRRTAAGWEVVVGPTIAPEVIGADAVVLAVPPPAAARLLRGHAPVASEVLAGMEMASVAVVTLAVERGGAGAPLDLPGSGFLVVPADGHVIKASTFSAAKWAWTGRLSPHVAHLRASVGRAGEVAELQRPDDDLVAVAVREIGEALGRPLSRLVDAHVQRWGGGLPQYAVGHVDAVSRVRADVAGVPGLEVCGTAYEGVGIPAVIATARGAAEATRAHLAGRPR